MGVGGSGRRCGEEDRRRMGKGRRLLIFRLKEERGWEEEEEWRLGEGGEENEGRSGREAPIGGCVCGD